MLPWQRPSGDPWPQLEAFRGEAYLEMDVAFLFFCLHPDFDTSATLPWGASGNLLFYSPKAPLIYRTVVQMAACFWYFPLDSWAPKRDCLPGISAQLRRTCLVLELLLFITSTNHNCTAGKRTLAASWRPLPCHFQNDILLSTGAGRKNGNSTTE